MEYKNECGVALDGPLEHALSRYPKYILTAKSICKDDCKRLWRKEIVFDTRSKSVSL